MCFFQVQRLTPTQELRWKTLQSSSAAAWDVLIGLLYEVALHGNFAKSQKSATRKQFTLFAKGSSFSPISIFFLGQAQDEEKKASMCDKVVDALFEVSGSDFLLTGCPFQSRALLAFLQACEPIKKRDFSVEGLEELFNFNTFLGKLCSRSEITPVFGLDWLSGEALIEFLFRLIKQIDRAPEELMDREKGLTQIRYSIRQNLLQIMLAYLSVKPTKLGTAYMSKKTPQKF